TLALRIFNLLHYGHNSQVNALCLTLLGLALGPLVVGTLWRRAKGESANPKAEIRNPREGRNPKSESAAHPSVATRWGKLRRSSRRPLHAFHVSVIPTSAPNRRTGDFRVRASAFG